MTPSTGEPLFVVEKTMSELLTNAWMILVVIAIITWIASIPIHGRFLSALRQRHADKWRELGSPGLFRGSPTYVFFVIRRRYTALEDSDLNRLGNSLRALLIFYIVIGLAVFVLTLKHNIAV